MVKDGIEIRGCHRRETKNVFPTKACMPSIKMPSANKIPAVQLPSVISLDLRLLKTVRDLTTLIFHTWLKLFLITLNKVVAIKSRNTKPSKVMYQLLAICLKAVKVEMICNTLSVPMIPSSELNNCLLIFSVVNTSPSPCISMTSMGVVRKL